MPVERKERDELRNLFMRENKWNGAHYDALAYRLADKVLDVLRAVRDAEIVIRTRERDCLAQAIGEAAQKAGITAPGAALSGPMLMMLCDDLAESGAAGVIAEREACAKIADDHAETWGLGMGTPAKVIAEAIRARTGETL